MTELMRDRRWLIALCAAVLSAVSAVVLVGVSAWFLGAAMLAAAAPIATAWSPPALVFAIRIAAFLRIGGKYTERSVGHAAALNDQVAHRQHVFTQMAGARSVRVGGWQLARADRLQHFISDVEAVDFERLRAVLPLLSLAVVGFLVVVATVAITPSALFPLTVLASVAVSGAVVLARRAARQTERAADLRQIFGERLGLAHGGMVSLQAGGTRRRVMRETFGAASQAEAVHRTARLSLHLAEGFLAAVGPVCALIIMAVGVFEGRGGAEALPVILVAVCWLAAAELFVPIARIHFAAAEGRRGRAALDAFASTDEKAPAQPAPHLALRDVPLLDPLGKSLGGRITFDVCPGAPVALLGPSGCGKTSLLKRLAGWQEWRAGPHPLKREAIARATSHLSLHDAAILAGSMRHNLFSDAPDKDLLAALDAVELVPRVVEVGGLDAEIRQDTLSLGEMRRVALARALLSSKELILFDEPGEHLDTEQAQKIFARVLERCADKSIVFVTHDEALASLAAHVVCMGSADPSP
ncbi:MAG: ATP-binding cassette domain-containing protein [Pseudomonadota bacterium]